MVDLAPKTKADQNEEWVNLRLAQNKLLTLLEEILEHPGYGEIQVDVKILRTGQKEVLFSCGKKYRFLLSPTMGKTKSEKIV